MRIDDIIDIGNQLDRIRNRALDLWTWLPSYRKATEHHGDYACEYQPPIDEIMREACEMFAYFRDKGVEMLPCVECPCGEEHDDDGAEE